MVLGIGEGKITLTLEKTILSPNEPIRGKAILQLSQPKKARALRLDIYTIEKQGKHHRQRVLFTKQLSGEKTYGSGESCEFEALAPSFPSSIQFPSQFGAMAGIISAFIPRPRYFVKVSLDTQMEFDLSGQVEIQIKNVQPGA